MRMLHPLQFPQQRPYETVLLRPPQWENVLWPCILSELVIVLEPDDLNTDVAMIYEIDQIDQDVPATKHLYAVSNKVSTACDSFTFLHWLILSGGSLMCTS
jgi:hypothetical protein